MYYPTPTFTKKPPSTVFGILHSNATFHWIFEFGSDQDWVFFEQISWGRTDGFTNRIRNRYLTVEKDGSLFINHRLPSPLKDRLFVTGNVSRNGCNLKFVLKNVTWSDQRTTYGCNALVYGDVFRSGPIELVIQGKAHLFLCVKLSFYKSDHPRSLPHKISVRRDLFKSQFIFNIN